MVSMNQVQKGLMKYIDNDVLPHLTAMKCVGLGTIPVWLLRILELWSKNTRIIQPFPC